jgi:hypothetical protein
MANFSEIVAVQSLRGKPNGLSTAFAILSTAYPQILVDSENSSPKWGNWLFLPL